MLKTAMLVSALAISAPALAQDKPAPKDNPTTAAQTPPVTDPQTTTDPAMTTAQPAPAPTEAMTPQTAPADTAPAAPQTIPGQPVTTPAPTPQSATPAAPTDPATSNETAMTPATPAAPAEAATGATQVAQVVDTEFPTYDKNSDTNLDKKEFGAWMVALKTASDPATKATDPATVKWVSGAFASADTDKSGAVSKEELTKYLSQGA